MCVAAVLPAVLGIASAGMQFMGQKQAADAQNAAANANIVSAREANNRAIIDNTRNFRAKAVETQQRRFDATLEGREAQGTAIAQAADAGTQGNSVMAMRNSLLRKSSQNDYRIASAFEANRFDYTNRVDTARAQAIDRINSMPYAAQPSILGLAINAASAVFA